MIRNLYIYMCLMLAGAIYASCSNTCNDLQQAVEGQPVEVNLVISPEQNTATRWADSNATDAEMMKNWTVVVTSTNNVIESILTSSYNTGVKEIDNLANILLTTGSKRFYSFANIALSELTTTTPVVGGTLQLKSLCNAPANGVIPQGGIPMSNMQTIVINNAQQQTIQLKVVRMMAKVTVKLYNASAIDIKVNSIGLSDITSHSAPIATLPPTSFTKSTNVGLYQYTPTAPIVIQAGTTLTNAQVATFYVNESALSSSDTPPYFTLRLNTDQGIKREEQRFALLDWQWFKRNEYSIIPVRLDDYKLAIKVVDYPPIGVYPASVANNADGSFTCTFSSNGEFQICPTITRFSDGSQLSYTLAGMAARSLPSGFFVTPPTYNTTTKEIVGNIGNVRGTALYELTFNVLNTDGTVARTLTYQLYFKR